jgi:cobalamin trafficking protein CblD
MSSISYSKRKRSLLILDAQQSKCGQLEYSVHYCSRSMKRELPKLLPESANFEELDSFRCIVTFQRCTSDLAASGTDVERDKELCLHRFICFAKKLRTQVEREQQLFEPIDPCSGLPLFGRRGSLVCNDLDVVQQLLPYSTEPVGMCRVVWHPIFKTNVYPALIFCTCLDDTHLIASLAKCTTS